MKAVADLEGVRRLTLTTYDDGTSMLAWTDVGTSANVHFRASESDALAAMFREAADALTRNATITEGE